MVLLQAVRQPLHSARHVAHFSLELKNVLLGQSELRPGDDDRRFSDPAWSQNPLYKRYMQTYLAWRRNCIAGSATATCRRRTSVVASSSSTC